MTTTRTAATVTFRGVTFELGNVGTRYTHCAFHAIPEGADRPVITKHGSEAAARKGRFVSTSTNIGIAPIDR